MTSSIDTTPARAATQAAGSTAAMAGAAMDVAVEPQAVTGLVVMRPAAMSRR